MLALVAHARAHDLAQAVDVEALQAQTLLDLIPHLFRPRFRAESADAKLDLVLGDTHLLHRLSQVQGIGRRTGDTGDAEVADQPGMLFSIAGRCRNDGRADHLHAVVRTETAGEKPVAIGNGENVVARHAEGSEAARHALGPDTDVLAGITHDGGVARGAGGSVNADDFAGRSGLKAERIVVPEVLLRREGEFHDVVDGADVIRGEVHLLQLVPIERNVMVHVLHNLVKPFALERAHFVAAHAFFVGIPDHISS